eukprot:5440256-Prymnesium_polylepis.1
MGGPPPPDTEVPIASAQAASVQVVLTEMAQVVPTEVGSVQAVAASVAPPIAQAATVAVAPLAKRRKTWQTRDSLLATRDSVQPEGIWACYTVAVDDTLAEGDQVRFLSVGAAAQTFVAPKIAEGQHHTFALRYTGTTMARVAVQLQVKALAPTKPTAAPTIAPPVAAPPPAAPKRPIGAPGVAEAVKPKRTKASVTAAVLA